MVIFMLTLMSMLNNTLHSLAAVDQLCVVTSFVYPLSQQNLKHGLLLLLVVVVGHAGWQQSRCSNISSSGSFPVLGIRGAFPAKTPGAAVI
jgi:hypothetical protein